MIDETKEILREFINSEKELITKVENNMEKSFTRFEKDMGTLSVAVNNLALQTERHNEIQLAQKEFFAMQIENTNQKIVAQGTDVNSLFSRIRLVERFQNKILGALIISHIVFIPFLYWIYKQIN